MHKKHIISAISIYVAMVVLGVSYMNFLPSLAAPPGGIGQFAPNDAYYLLAQANPSLPNGTVHNANDGLLYKVVAQSGVTCSSGSVIPPGGLFVVPANLLGVDKGLKISGVLNLIPNGAQDAVTFKLNFGGVDILEHGYGTDENTVGTYPFEVTVYNLNNANSQITYNIMQLKNYTPYPQFAYPSIISKHTSIDTTVNQNLVLECGGGGNDTVNIDLLKIELLP